MPFTYCFSLAVLGERAIGNGTSREGKRAKLRQSWFAALEGGRSDGPGRSIQPNFRRRIGGRNHRKPRAFCIVTCCGEIGDDGRSKRKRHRLRLWSTADCRRSTDCRSVRTIVSNREAGNERRSQDGSDLAAKSAVAARSRGGAGLRTIIGARAARRLKRRRRPHPPPRPLRPPGPTECNADKGGAPIAVNDGRAAMSDATGDERVKSQPRRRLPEQLPRNSVRRSQPPVSAV